jgi:UDP-N-acetyl-D-glucosamine dehydrogenase
MPRYVRELAIQALNRHRKSLNGSKILLLGVAYKKDVADLRESPALTIIDLLEQDGAVISYCDPHLPELRQGRLDLKAVELTAETLAGADCAIIVTDHSAFDYDLIVQNAPLIVDTRNALGAVREGREKIILL